MGWFDFLFGKRTPETPRTRLENAWKEWWRQDDPSRLALLQAALEVELQPWGALRFVSRESDTELQVRGELGTIPFRVKVPLHSLDIEIEAKFGNPYGFIDLEWDPEVNEGDPTTLDPMWDEDEVQRVFLAPHLFIEGSDAATEAAHFARLPAELRQRILRCMVDSKIRFFRIRPELTELSPSRSDGHELQMLFDLNTLLTLLRDLGQTLGRTPPLIESSWDVADPAHGSDVDEEAEDDADEDGDEEEEDWDDGSADYEERVDAQARGVRSEAEREALQWARSRLLGLIARKPQTSLS